MQKVQRYLAENGETYETFEEARNADLGTLIYELVRSQARDVKEVDAQKVAQAISENYETLDALIEGHKRAAMAERGPRLVQTDDAS